jgi:hypothetical protein
MPRFKGVEWNVDDNIKPIPFGGAALAVLMDLRDEAKALRQETRLLSQLLAYIAGVITVPGVKTAVRTLARDVNRRDTARRAKARSARLKG